MTLCEATVPTYFIEGAEAIGLPGRIRHYDIRRRAEQVSADWLPADRPVTIALMAGASCPDMLLDQVIHRVIGLFPSVCPPEDVLAPFEGVAVV